MLLSKDGSQDQDTEDMDVVSDWGTGRNILDSPGPGLSYRLELTEVKKPGLRPQAGEPNPPSYHPRHPGGEEIDVVSWQ